MSTAKNSVIKLSEYVDVSKVVDRMMLAMGLANMQEFADFLGCTIQAAYNYRGGRRDIPWSAIFRVHVKTGKSLDWLVYGKTDEKRVVPIPIGRNTRDIVLWVEEQGELAKDFDGMVRVAVGIRFPEFLEWQKKRAECGECGTPSGKESVANEK